MASPLASSTYKGLQIRCAPGAHEAALVLLQSHGIASCSVLDLAAGSGAWLARLKDAGFVDLEAVELDAAKFGVAGIAPRAIDLNRDFAEAIERRFGLVSAIEIIEHLDSPRAFLGQIHRLLENDGYLLLTTPNFADLIGRAKFLLTGELRYFDADQYRYNHHISPIPDTIVRLMLHESGFDLVAHQSVGSFSSRIKLSMLKMLSSIARPILRRLETGEVNLYLARRAAAARVSRPEDWTPER